eukprot:6584059-Prymnesium_polylepis.1
MTGPLAPGLVDQVVNHVIVEGRVTCRRAATGRREVEVVVGRWLHVVVARRHRRATHLRALAYWAVRQQCMGICMCCCRACSTRSFSTRSRVVS